MCSSYVTVVSGTNNIYLDFNQNAIYIVNGTITANLSCYISNIPTLTDRTYTVSMIIPFTGTGIRYYANTLNVSNTSSSYAITNMYADGGLSSITPNSSATFITQTISIFSSSLLNPSISAITVVGSMY